MELKLSVQRDKVEQVKEAAEKPAKAEVSVQDEFPKEESYWPTVCIDFPWRDLDRVVQALHRVFDGG